MRHAVRHRNVWFPNWTTQVGNRCPLVSRPSGGLTSLWSQMACLFRSPQALSHFTQKVLAINPYWTPVQTTASVRHPGSAAKRWCLWGWCKMEKGTAPCRIWFLVVFPGEIPALWCQVPSLCWRGCQESRKPWICWPLLHFERLSARSARRNTVGSKLFWFWFSYLSCSSSYCLTKFSNQHKFHPRLKLLVFSVTPYKIDQNKKYKPFNRLSLESGNRKKVEMQRLSPRFRSQQFFLRKIWGETFFPNL